MSDKMQQTQNSMEGWESRFGEMEREIAKLRLRMRITWACVVLVVGVTFVLGMMPEAQAQGGLTLASLARRVQRLESKLRFITVTTESGGRPSMVISNTNVSIRGSGNTNSGPKTRSTRSKAPGRKVLKGTRKRRHRQNIASRGIVDGDGAVLKPILRSRLATGTQSSHRGQSLEIPPAPVR